ncbi:hypothetical protein Vretifemale_394 [Volvox reticuliferus]|uniref:Uncharacterized protein n=1 Tax=Volvox reticuliferus TaxID=1737510 RepID=A0A8J4BY47_9CHLO|nr:hypothetical protein Vretifemale_394 [Volvox reticuliferus]
MYVSTYEGLEAGGSCESHGVVTWPGRRERYEGQLRGSQPHGYGAYRWRDGTLYRGEWYDGRMQGCGVLIWKDEQDAIQAKAGKFFRDDFVGPVPGCSTEAAHEAALEADVAAGRARVFETHMSRRQVPVSYLTASGAAADVRTRGPGQPGPGRAPQSAASEVANGPVDTGGVGGDGDIGMVSSVISWWPWAHARCGVGAGGWAARGAGRGMDMADRRDNRSNGSTGDGQGVVGPSTPRWKAIQQLHLAQTQHRGGDGCSRGGADMGRVIRGGGGGELSREHKRTEGVLGSAALDGGNEGQLSRLTAEQRRRLEQLLAAELLPGLKAG